MQNKKFIYALSFCLLVCLTVVTCADSQILQRLGSRFRSRRATVTSNCPGGVCPTDQVYQSANHWTYPGTIQNHLATDHGVSTSGMSRQQMLNLHDALHEGRAVSSFVSSPAPVPALPPIPVAPVETATIPVIADEPVDIPIQVAEKGFRRELLKAITKSRGKGDINARQAMRLRVACFSPAFLEKAEELCVVQMAMSVEGGEYLEFNADGTVDQTAIDWEGLAGFLERIIPLLLELFKAFGL